MVGEAMLDATRSPLPKRDQSGMERLRKRA